MILAKKLIFGLLFLSFLIGTIIFALPIIKDSSLILSLNSETLYKLIILSTLILATSITFAIFKALTFGLLLISSPSSLLSPTVKQVTTILTIILSIVCYLSINKEISQNSFEIPDSLIESSLKFMPQTNLPAAQLPQLPAEQIELLKKNPELLKQYNIDPQLLNNLSGTETTNIKPMIKEQLQNIIKPYQSFIAPILALLLFLTLQSFTAILGILISPIIWMIFYILEKTGFVHFQTEMREVKKLVV